MTTKAVWFPSEDVIKSTRLYQWMSKLGYSNYEQFLQACTEDVSWFWEHAEKELGIQWDNRYDHVLHDKNDIKWPKWYENGQLNTVTTTIEKWANKEETRNQIALVWEGDNREVREYTFAQLQEEISRISHGLKANGIKRGDIVAIYLPMVPEAVISMLAVAKIGAIFSPIFSGYGADAIATRLNAAGAKMLITADGFWRRGKQVKMKEEADKAVEMALTVEKVVVFRRLQSDISWDSSRNIDWDELKKTEELKATETMESSEALMLIYTSGTTGKPKGAVHSHAGFPIKAAFDAGIGMDVKQGDRLFWFTDMGWMMGPFLVFGGLINGASIVLYEGTPDYPKPDRLWDVVTRHQVTHLGISPTLVRALMKYGESWVDGYDLSRLRVIGSTGEPWNPEPWLWLFEKVGKGKIPIFNYSGGTEISGGILGNVLIRPIGPVTFNSPLPGMEVKVFNTEGKEIIGEVGELVITKPWVGMTHGFWNEPERYENSYWNRWPNVWVHGDWVIKDNEGYWTITGRSDDILNVAGKRIGPAEMESVLVGNASVLEAATIGVPDEIKGEAAVCFVVVHEPSQATEELKNELIALIANKMGKALKPKTVHFVKDIPKTRNAKVMRRVIRSAYLNKPTGDLSSLENPEAVKEILNLMEDV